MARPLSLKDGDAAGAAAGAVGRGDEALIPPSRSEEMLMSGFEEGAGGDGLARKARALLLVALLPSSSLRRGIAPRWYSSRWDILCPSSMGE